MCMTHKIDILFKRPRSRHFYSIGIDLLRGIHVFNENQLNDDEDVRSTYTSKNNVAHASFIIALLVWGWREKVVGLYYNNAL